MAKKTILIMEDESALQRLISMIVEKSDFDSVAFDSGVEGLAWLAAGHHADLVLLDLMMPGKNGIEVLEDMAKHGWLATTPVTLLTGSIDEKLVLRGIELGAKDYLSKPFMPKDLIERVKKHLNESSSHP